MTGQGGAIRVTDAFLQAVRDDADWELLRRKDGKQHRYLSDVENRRVRGGRVVQRHLLHLGPRKRRRSRSQSRYFEIPFPQNWR